MANRTVTFSTYAADGSRYSSPSAAPTISVRYEDGTSATPTATANGAAWDVVVDDAKDGIILWSGSGIQAGDVGFSRFPYTQLGTTERAPAATALSNATWTDTKAGYLDASVTSREASGAAESAVAGLNDFDPATQTVTLAPGQIPTDYALEATAQDIKDQTDQITFTDGKVDANATVDPEVIGPAVWTYTSRTLTSATPEGWVLITENTLDTEGVPLGPVDAADVLISAYSGATIVNTTRSEGDGGFRISVPTSAVYKIRAYRVGYVYPERTVIVE